jgi:serine/threonine-protein kinase
MEVKDVRLVSTDVEQVHQPRDIDSDEGRKTLHLSDEWAACRLALVRVSEEHLGTTKSEYGACDFITDGRAPKAAKGNLGALDAGAAPRYCDERLGSEIRMDEQSEKLKSALEERYRIEHLLGQGGMALVYLATDLRHDREVALAASLGADRFLQEIHLTAKLSHPHVLPLYDSGEANGILYYVMPFVDGESLGERLKREKQLPIEECVSITREVAEALGHAHNRGLVHRDVKPGNILLSEGNALVADFGISRAVSAAGGERLTQTGMSLGTPAYMSPEQAAGDPDIDGRSDVYSLGCVLYEMLVGQIPFPAPTLQAMMARHTMEQPPSAAVMRPATPPDLERIVIRAMSKNPVDRFKDGADMAKALTTMDAGTVPTLEPKAASVVPPGTGRGTRRLLVPALTVALVVLAAVSGWWFARGGSNASSATESVPTLAILPFENVGDDPNDDYFAVGLESELAAVLSGVEGLAVTGRRSTRAFRGSAEDPATIGRRLEASAVLAVDVSKSGDDLLIIARLVNTDNGLPFWSQRYERTVADVFEVQEDIAQSVVAHLAADRTGASDAVSVGAPTTNAMAHDKYLWGEFNLERRTREGAADAVDNFTMSISFDSAFAGAHAGLADAQLALLSYSAGSSGDDVLQEAAEAASTALRLNPDLARARVALGLVNVYRYDWEGAEAEYVRAIELSPDDPLVRQRYAELLASVGRLEAAATHAQRAVDGDFLSSRALHTLLHVQRAKRDAAEAIRTGQRMLDINANDPGPWLDLGILFLTEGRTGDASNALERYAELMATDPSQFQAFVLAAGTSAESGEAGTVPQAVADLLADRPVDLAVMHQLAGGGDAALAVLERALRDRHPGLAALTTRPALAPLFGTPRFRAIAADIGLNVPPTP